MQPIILRARKSTHGTFTDLFGESVHFGDPPQKTIQLWIRILALHKAPEVGDGVQTVEPLGHGWCHLCLETGLPVLLAQKDLFHTPNFCFSYHACKLKGYIGLASLPVDVALLPQLSVLPSLS